MSLESLDKIAFVNVGLSEGSAMAGTTRFKTISDIVALYGVSLRTLRFYEAKGLLEPIRSNNARLYSDKHLIRLELILKGQRLGFSLAEIAKLIGVASIAVPDASETNIEIRKEQIEAQIQKLDNRRRQLEETLADLNRSAKDES